MTLPLRTRPTNVPKLHYRTLVQTKMQQTDADTNVLAKRAGRPLTTVPTNTAEHRNAANTNATNQQ